ncbi:Hypothetical predicted protein [Mytilus galloprovincialis]|uniref:B box-type domain-containing protein n=1 Tax=Mytilus galloprovincialis TaxID=29158 RepID=A0A8B6GGG0_MYTGA|nr:Hypothetical predicted protein [Mytilus galloprovincialis]
MATSTGVSCGICLKNGNDKAAIIWCPECESALCDRCSEQHNQSNKTINHKTTTVDVLFPRIQIPIRSHNAQLGLANKFDVDESGIYAFCLLPNNDFVFVNRARVFSIWKYDGSFKGRFSINFDGMAHDITSIDNSTVAFTKGNNESDSNVLLVDIGEKKIVKTIPRTVGCFGIEHDKGKLYICSYRFGLCSANISDCVVSDFFELMGEVLYVTMSNSNICMSKSYTDDITLFDPSANIIWKFVDHELLRSPTHLTSDANGNIYVIGKTSYNVVFISADGKQSRQLLGREDGMESMVGIHYDKGRKVLIIANMFGNVTIYNCP